MISLTRWPSPGIKRTTQTLTLPLSWLRTFQADLYDIRLLGTAENISHAVILAVHEMAERLRQEQGETQ